MPSWKFWFEIQQVNLTGWKKFACAPRDSNLKQVSRFPVRTLEWSCWKKKKKNTYSYELTKLNIKALFKNLFQFSLNHHEQPFLLTLLKSLAVELSSSRQGMRWTNASIWYLALINSDLFGLLGECETWNKQKERGNESVAHTKLRSTTINN